MASDTKKLTMQLDAVLHGAQAMQLRYLPTRLKTVPLVSLLTTGVGLIAGFCVLYMVVTSITAWYRLRHFPGPSSAGFSYIWLALMSISGKSYKTQMELNRKYGHLARVGPNELITDDPDLIKLMGSARSSWARSNWYNSGRVHPADDTILNVVDTATHDKLRHSLIPGYSGRDNALEHDVDGQLVNLIRAIRRKYISTATECRPLDFVKLSQYFTVDTMTQISFGQPFGCLDADDDRNELLETVERIVVWGEITANVPWMQTLLSYGLIFYTLAYPLARDVGAFNKLAERIVAERWNTKSKSQRHKDMLASFMNHGFSQRMCELQVPVQLTAGTETTATAIRSTLLHLLTSPRAYAKLQNEIDQAIANGGLSTPISFREAKDLPYVSAVVYEGLRIHPPFSGQLMKEVPPEGITYTDGRFIPGGTYIGHNTWSAMRDKSIFGDDADMFRPERFIEASPEARANMRSTVDLVFGYGRWQCMGRPISMMELHKVFVELLRNFDIQIMYPHSPIKTFNVNLFLQSDMWVRVTERTPGSSGPEVPSKGVEEQVSA
ncbi:uncharacterized protein A1O5_10632 [Cladophialophora psammophila CBS 110553]|uniref:Cytochrome P450 oxidoreductase n=1 Tax=Cladophialophora psammophila CBS 110553 TaxID=1182543 RepID=W9WN91_9EURO|nr:uncharacterized protein A1O5_10632 [Cladophialophora psammophila CBS 110553]EXJ66480.1 hypothetical protein A1O5_10632 [Cladophialophora psammophila CBS 110553]